MFRVLIGLFISFASFSAQALWNGQVAKGGQFPAAVSYNSCSGVRIGPRHILTAAHCVYQETKFFEDGKATAGHLFKEYISGRVLKVNYGVDPTAGQNQGLKIRKVHVHSSYKNIKSKIDFEQAADIAIIEFEHRMTSKIKIAKVSDQQILVGSPVTLAGFGLTGPSVFDQSLIFGNTLTSQEERVQNSLAFGESYISRINYNTYLIAASGRAQPMRGDLPLLGKGDSGGALYDSRDERNLTVIGINSQSNILGAGSYVTRVDGECGHGVFRWIKSVLSRTHSY